MSDYLGCKLPVAPYEDKPYPLEWWVIVSDYTGGDIVLHNVFAHSGFMRDIKAAARKFKNTQRDEFIEQLRRELFYYYSTKCEWEIVIDHWPPSEDKTRLKPAKIDVYDQVLLNWDLFCDYVWSHRAILRRREVEE